MKLRNKLKRETMNNKHFMYFDGAYRDRVTIGHAIVWYHGRVDYFPGVKPISSFNLDRGGMDVTMQ